MPFVTEELWQRLPKHNRPQPESIMVAAYPQSHSEWRCPALEEEMDFLLEVVKVVRSLRSGESHLGSHSRLAFTLIRSLLGLLRIRSLTLLWDEHQAGAPEKGRPCDWLKDLHMAESKHHHRYGMPEG